jgi:hypothetical protein
MSIATDVRFYADTALAQGKAALSNAGNAAVLVNRRLVSDAPKPAYAVLGAADLVASAVSRRVEALPVEAVGSVSKVQQNGRTLLTRTQNDAIARLGELRGRLDASLESVSTLPAVARNTTEAYLSTAKELYGKLTARGEEKAAELRNDPRVSRLLGSAGEFADSVQRTVTPVASSAFDAVESMSPVETEHATRPVTGKATAAASTPRKSTAAKCAAAKSTAAKSSAAKSSAAKSTATKNSTGKSTAAKSTGTTDFRPPPRGRTKSPAPV